MDNLTHSLTGLALARSGLNRFSTHGTALAIISSNIPDSDILAISGGSLKYFEAHRGYTHSLLLLPVMAAVSVLLVAAIFRTRLPWRKAFLLCCICVAGHLLLDWTNSYGIRLLLPFSSRWFFADLNSLYDGVILGVLVLAALWPFLNALVSNEIGSRASGGRGISIFALCFFGLFDCGRAVLHARAIGKMETRLYDEMPAVAVAALPTAFNPLRWRGVVETDRTLQLLDVSALAPLDLSSTEVFFKISPRYGFKALEETEPFHYLSYFARFPVWSEQPVISETGTAVRVELTDLRFGVPGGGSFHAIAVQDGQGRVVKSWFTFGSGANVGLTVPGQQPRAADAAGNE